MVSSQKMYTGRVPKKPFSNIGLTRVELVIEFD